MERHFSILLDTQTVLEISYCTIAKNFHWNFSARGRHVIGFEGLFNNSCKSHRHTWSAKKIKTTALGNQRKYQMFKTLFTVLWNLYYLFAVNQQPPPWEIGALFPSDAERTGCTCRWRHTTDVVQLQWVEGRSSASDVWRHSVHPARQLRDDRSTSSSAAPRRPAAAEHFTSARDRPHADRHFNSQPVHHLAAPVCWRPVGLLRRADGTFRRCPRRQSPISLD